MHVIFVDLNPVQIIAFLGERYRWHVKDYAQLEDLLRVAPAGSRGNILGGILRRKVPSRYTGGNKNQL